MDRSINLFFRLLVTASACPPKAHHISPRLPGVDVITRQRRGRDGQRTGQLLHTLHQSIRATPSNRKSIALDPKSVPPSPTQVQPQARMGPPRSKNLILRPLRAQPPALVDVATRSPDLSIYGCQLVSVCRAGTKCSCSFLFVCATSTASSLFFFLARRFPNQF